MKKLSMIFGIVLTSNVLYGQWLLTGNTPGPSNFLGTTNAQDLSIKTEQLQNINFFTFAGAGTFLNQRMTIIGNGLVGIGTAAPTNQLQVNGAALSTVFRTDNNVGVAPLWSMFKGASNIGNLYGNGGANNIFNVEANMADLYLWGRANNAGTNNALRPRVVVSNGTHLNILGVPIVNNITRVGINWNPRFFNPAPQSALPIDNAVGFGTGGRNWIDCGK
ncbi:MAG: hypothetical protein IPP29_03510 [Bacteroidetes bacterium]|nr:hypothetical protein [Bacteroidota bacterium]